MVPIWCFYAQIQISIFIINFRILKKFFNWLHLLGPFSFFSQIVNLYILSMFIWSIQNQNKMRVDTYGKYVNEEKI